MLGSPNVGCPGLRHRAMVAVDARSSKLRPMRQPTLSTVWCLLCRHSVRDSPVLLTGGEHCPRNTRQLVGHRDDQHVAWRSHLKRGPPMHPSR